MGRATGAALTTTLMGEETCGDEDGQVPDSVRLLREQSLPPICRVQFCRILFCRAPEQHDDRLEGDVKLSTGRGACSPSGDIEALFAPRARTTGQRTI